MWAQIKCFMGELAQSITNFERVKPTLKSKGTSIDLVVNLLNGAWRYCGLATTQFHRGDWQAALSIAAQATGIGRRVGNV